MEVAGLVASGEGDGTGGEGYSLVSEYWGNGLSIYDPEGNKIHTVMAVVMFSLWALTAHSCGTLHLLLKLSWSTVVGLSPARSGGYASYKLPTYTAMKPPLAPNAHMHIHDLDEHVEDQRMFDCVNVLLKMQNTNGGYASNETKRGGAILEILSPSQVFRIVSVEH
eukprot:Em0004g745a